MKPKMQQLDEAENQLNTAQAILGTKRVEANQIKGELENHIRYHKIAVQATKAIEKKIQVLDKEIAKASHVMNTMTPQHVFWKSQQKKSKSRLRTCCPDAMLTAAAVCYFGPLSAADRNALLDDWLSRCEHGNFSGTDVVDRLDMKEKVDYDSEKISTSNDSGDAASLTSRNPLAVREDFSIIDVLSNYDEQSRWRVHNLGMDQTAVYNALIMRASSLNMALAWPLLVDTNCLAEKWVRALELYDNEIHEEDLCDVRTRRKY